MSRPAPTNNLVVVSDIHAGCKLALCPPEGARTDDGGVYRPSAFQRKIWAYWDIFWKEFVPEATKGEPYTVVINGDAREGIHHRSTTPISHNEEDQEQIAFNILAPLVKLCGGEIGPNDHGDLEVKKGGRFYMIRGTEAHVGSSAVSEERLAKRLKAIPNAEGQYARYELWKMVGPKLVHLLHHVGTAGSNHYESTAVHKELVESFTEAGRWGRRPPDCIVRSHRHRHIETVIATGSDKGETSRAMAVVTPAWQGKTPFVWKIPARLTTPQFGGIVLRYAHDELFIRSKVWTVGRSAVE